ncbi:MAG TPA: DoxX family protein [Vicinamibacterales bacterium]|nr:DoxX family protein [Vicinamibacterales bacterium]
MTTRWQRYAAWAGWLVTCAPVFIVLSSARWKLTHNAWYVQEFGRIGWPVSALETLAVFQLTGIALLLIPWTSVLGAIILTGYLGGAVATYVRIGEWYPPLVPFSTAVLAWLGLFLREPRLWVLLPFRRRS